MKQSNKTLIFCLLSLVVGLALGALMYAQTMARANVIAGACTIVNQAVEKGMLQPEQVRPLGAAVGAELQRHYGSVASKMAVPQGSAEHASAQSMCSQFLVGVQEAAPAPAK